MRWLIFVALAALCFIFLFHSKKKQKPQLDETIVESTKAIEVSEDISPSNSNNVEKVSPVNAAAEKIEQKSKENPNNELQKPLHLTKAQFLEVHRPNDLKELLAQSQPFSSTKDKLLGTYGRQESGVIGTSNGELEYRYFITGNDDDHAPHGCISFRGADRKLILGSTDDGTLAIRELPIEHTFIFIIKDKYYLMTYSNVTGWGEQPGPDNHGENDPNVMLYYLKQLDGRILYQGKRESLTYHEEDMQLKNLEFCRFFPGGER